MSDMRPVLDPCCGSRMFWFDRADPRAVFGDRRHETHQLADKSSAGGSRQLVIAPDVLLDFRALPFADASFHLVVFDPPHLVKNGKSGWLAKKYGKLGADWREDIRAGFAECFRVLRPHGTLIFKWNEEEIRVSEILALTDQKPLFGNRCGDRFTDRMDHLDCPGPFPASWWSESEGDVLWWCWRDGAWLGEAPYVGSPLDLGYTVELHARDAKHHMRRMMVGGWPGYHTHWTRLPPMPHTPTFLT